MLELIYSDEWAAYLNMSEKGYIHETVNHTEEFRSDSGCCTNNIEGIWSLAKHCIKKMKGVLPGRLQHFLDEFPTVIVLEKVMGTTSGDY